MTVLPWPHEVYIDGKIVPSEQAAVSFEDRGFQFGDGVYEVVRSYGGRLFEMDRHMKRLHRGATFLELGIADRHLEEIRDAALRLLQRSTLSEATIVIQVTRGSAPRSHLPPEGMQPTVVVYVRPSTWPPREILETGIAVITVSDSRWAHVDIKGISLVPNVLAKLRADRAGAADAIFIRDGFVTDGPASNVFAVMAGVVRTPPQSNYILSGITREVILELCAEEGRLHAEESIRDSDLAVADELFLTGTTDEVTPIVKVDGIVVGDGRPGPVTQQLLKAFRRRVEA